MTRLDPPDWLLERYQLGEATPAQRARVDAARAADPQVDARLAALSRDADVILAAHPPARVAAAIRQAVGAPQAPARRAWLVPALAVAAVALAVVLLPRFSASDDTRLKGAASTLSLYALGPQGPVAIAAGERLKPGAVVQARYHLTAPAWVVLLSFDAAGSVTVHTPSTWKDAGTHAMETAFELDQSPGFERFVLITSSAPLAEAGVQAAARAAARSGAPSTTPLSLDGAAQRSVVVFKDLP